MFAFIKDFITDRTFQVQIGNERSSTRTLENGTPQGSVISPILFLIMINDMSAVINGAHLSLFADDSATYKSGKNLQYIMKEIQKNVNQIQSWCEMWGFKISIEKSCTVIFTNKKRPANLIKPIEINGKSIKTEKEVKFLGMIIDQSLTWKSHVKYITDKCKKRINLMKSLAGTRWGAGKRSQLTLYRSLIRSVIEYGAVAYDNAAPSHKKQLQSIQTTALRICCGAFKSTAAAALQVDCGEMPLDLSRKRQQLIYAAKIKSQKNHPNAGILEDHWTKHYGRYKPGNEPWSTRVTDIIEQLNIQPTDTINAPPWENKSFRR
jgi:hypothetical protein